MIPSGWAGFEAVRKYRGVTYRISVKRSGKGNSVSLKVNGQAVVGDLIPLPAPGTDEVVVEVKII